MADVYMYADETGNLDYEGTGKDGASPYFGFATAVFDRDHGTELWNGMALRAGLEGRGLNLPRGFHAKDDSLQTKDDMFAEIARQAPRFDTTFLYKPGAYPYVRERGQMYLYQMAWYQHFKYVAQRVSRREDTLYVIAGSFGTAARKREARTALRDVCTQVNRRIVLCVWDAPTSWGLQVADYGAWAAHRHLVGSTCRWFEPAIEPTLHSIFTPWGKA